MKPLRRHLNYANVVATLALVFAMSGGALAANHYLINSTKQIKPSVLRHLKGTRGATGASGHSGAIGSQGPTGSTGPTGAKGTNGTNGTNGKEGQRGEAGLSATSDLPSGASESGDFGLALAGGKAGETFETSVSFPIPLEEDAPASQIITTDVKTPVTHCAGPGQADRGFVCIYIYKTFSLDTATKLVFNPEVSPAPAGTGRFGFVMAWTQTGGEPDVLGTYTVTAG